MQETTYGVRELYSIHLEVAMKVKVNTLAFIVNIKAKEHQIKQPVKKLCDIRVANGNTLSDEVW